ncbi:hypothetical protein D0469_07525 [Peribacillus saganii]|uniref:Uncharacterized protein YyaB-like PH domain-containing protein n=1 Tax=Peribacillus saganii TaxID=2303992 RepID=A0A372LQE3_9BACI|nr:PH domain-containing protein [Peribacillus saganii]RFU70428.1 hypothetical protein D0469_07525 [Peribacillus saganii]
MRFYSEKSPILSLILWGTATAALITGIIDINEEGLGPIVIGVLLALFIGWLWLTTYYEITDNILLVSAGPIRKRIDIYTIRSLNKTRNPVSSPALSFDRIEIVFNMYDSVIISPKDKEAFAAELKKINPDIKVNLKN